MARQLLNDREAAAAGRGTNDSSDSVESAKRKAEKAAAEATARADALQREVTILRLQTRIAVDQLRACGVPAADVTAVSDWKSVDLDGFDSASVDSPDHRGLRRAPSGDVVAAGRSSRWVLSIPPTRCLSAPLEMGAGQLSAGSIDTRGSGLADVG
eukprot:jgi/Tetstr1/449775/TSEL_036839.t1